MIQYRNHIPALMLSLGLPMTGAELGIAEGQYSRDLLAGGLEKLYMVDLWATIKNQTGDIAQPQEWHDMNMKGALARVAKYGDKAVILRGITWEMAYQVPDESLGLLHLDAGHLYSEVMNDLQAWFPKLVDGGLCTGHDYLNRAYGVNQAVRDFTNGKFEVHTMAENKPEDAGFLFVKK
jgi:hypothetical protein